MCYYSSLGVPTPANEYTNQSCFEFSDELGRTVSEIEDPNDETPDRS